MRNKGQNATRGLLIINQRGTSREGNAQAKTAAVLRCYNAQLRIIYRTSIVLVMLLIPSSQPEATKVKETFLWLQPHQAIQTSCCPHQNKLRASTPCHWQVLINTSFVAKLYGGFPVRTFSEVARTSANW